VAGDQKKPQIQLDWATISYRSIMRGVVYVVLLVALGGLFFYLKASLRVSPQDRAKREIGRASESHAEAMAAAGEDPALRRSASRSGTLLASARDAFGRHEYAGARAAAEQSIELSRKIINGSADDPFAANLFKYEGDVKVKRARQFVWKGISESTSLSVGDQIKTASNGSAQILYFDGTITTVKPGSLVEIRLLFEDPKTKVRKIREKVNWGGVTARTAGANVAGSFHEVSTESATARSVSRSEFEVDYNAETRITRAVVHGGQAEVKAAGRTVTLKPLERLEVTGGKVVTSRLPAAPRLLEPADNRVIVERGQDGPVVLLRWVKVKKARRYRLQIARTPLFGERLLDKTDIHSTRVEIPGLERGTYYWRVAAVDRKQVESPFSESRKFRVETTATRHSDDREPPMLTLNDFLPSGHLVIINGTTEPGAVLTVSGQVVDVYEDGAFTAVVRMKREGRNELEIIAQDQAGNQTRLRRTVFVESF
jgi:hypothetical protein